MDTNEFVTERDVAEWLHLPVSRVVRMARRGDIPSVKLPGGDLVFSRFALREWINQSKPTEGPAHD
jgi:excisionase family DNA binding protein